MSVCPTCYQPECSESTDGERPTPGSIPQRVAPGRPISCGYGEWAVHPEEAQHILHRGHVLVDGEPRKARFVRNEAFIAQIFVEGTKTDINIFEVAS